MAWWDDIWLNEGFATWMASKIVDGWKPEWDVKVSRVRSTSGVMGADSLVSARKIRQPIVGKGDIENAFDGITYQKGAAALRMFEEWIGEAALAGGTQLWNIDDGSDFAWSFRVPASALESSGGAITIETGQFFRPADRGQGADKRALGLRVYLVKLKPAS